MSLGGPSGDVALQTSIAGPIHLPHAAGPMRRKDVVRAELSAGCESQEIRYGLYERGQQTERLPRAFSRQALDGSRGDSDLAVYNSTTSGPMADTRFPVFA